MAKTLALLVLAAVTLLMFWPESTGKADRLQNRTTFVKALCV
jgi:hypothetical protein